MSTTTLSRITLQTMANYRDAFAQVVAAYGAGSRRLVRAVDGTLHTQVLARAARLAPYTGARIDDLRGSLSRLVQQGIERLEHAAAGTVARGSTFARSQVTRLADVAGGAKAPFVVAGLDTATRLSMPAAQFALGLSARLAEGATALAEAAGAPRARRAPRKASKSTRRGTARTAARARKHAGRTTSTRPVQRTRKSATKAAAAA